MKNGTRWPPSYSLPLPARMPALNVRQPDDEPLSVVKIKIVLSARPCLSRNARIVPTLWSMFAIMP